MPTPLRQPLPSVRLSAIAAVATLLLVAIPGCRHSNFPDVPDGYHEFAYVTNGTANTVTVLDLVYLRRDRTLSVGLNPTGITANPNPDKTNPHRNEVYVVNSQSGSVSVIDAEANRVVATIPVRRLPYFISVDASGHRAYVANSGSNNVSILDLDRRHEVAVIGTGEAPGLARISPDMRSLVVTNRAGGSVSIFNVDPYPAPPRPPRLRSVFNGCPGATDAVILPDSSKAFIACSTGHQVMAINLSAAPGSWPAKNNPSLTTDHFLTFLEVGKTPVSLTMKPDGGEIFVSNFDSDSISEIATNTNEVGSTYPIGNKPVHGLVSNDGGTLWIANFGADSIARYSIDDGRMLGSVRTGPAPDALVFSADEHLLLAADTHSGDVAVIRTKGNPDPDLFTILPGGGSPNAIAIKAFMGKP